MNESSLRDDIVRYAETKYGASPERLWARYPGYAVFRHADSRKWFGLIMDVPNERLGLPGEDITDILNVKLEDPLLADLLVQQPGYLRGYHLRRGNWISIRLDGSVPREDVCRWLDESYKATASAQKKKALRPPKEWIIPANPKYYDIVHAFDHTDEIEWKQGAGIRKGDTVFVYVAAPVSAILYRCKVTGTDIPYRYTDGRLTIRALMRIRLEKRYDPSAFPFERLGSEYGIFAVRGPRGIPERLSEALQ